ncbi:hypothetical protein C8R45DRAFT_1075599 [Mycena sanguinolenta]|nr:hypothetical protein C8R45DRAFT_1075599 [Mycena sanguinolenta]
MAEGCRPYADAWHPYEIFQRNKFTLREVTQLSFDEKMAAYPARLPLPRHLRPVPALTPRSDSAQHARAPQECEPVVGVQRVLRARSAMGRTAAPERRVRAAGRENGATLRMREAQLSQFGNQTDHEVDGYAAMKVSILMLKRELKLQKSWKGIEAGSCIEGTHTHGGGSRARVGRIKRRRGSTHAKVVGRAVLRRTWSRAGNELSAEWRDVEPGRSKGLSTGRRAGNRRSLDMEKITGNEREEGRRGACDEGTSDEGG